MAMSLEDLPNDELMTLDYILNYTPSERIEPVFEEEMLNDLEEFITHRVETDNYSNDYDVFYIDDELRGNVIDVVDRKFDVLFTDSIEKELRTLFEDRPHDTFQFYNEVSDDFNTQVDDEKSLQPYVGDYNDLIGLLQDLHEIGIGFRKRYLTTTDNYYEQFEFRTKPIDGLEIFLETADSIVEEHLKDLTPAERWAAYIHVYLNNSNVFDNLDGYSHSQIESALNRPQVVAKENIAFLNEEIKKHLKDKLQAAIERDTHYLTVLEFLFAISEEQSHLNRNSQSINISELEEFGSRRLSGELESYIQQLHEEGLLLVQSGQYILTEEVLTLLDEIEERSKIESHPIETLEDAHNTLYEILGQATEEIKIIDRYFTRNALRIVESNAPNDVEIKVLYSDDVDEDDIGQLRSELNERTVDDSKYDFKEMRPLLRQGVPHDRFIIIDNHKVWQVGHSFNGLGTDFSTIFSHSEKESPHYVKLFDGLWQIGEELSW